MSATLSFVPGDRDLSRAPSVPNGVLGMMIFVACEVMFFLALFSAYFISKSKVGVTWAPPGDIRLPILATGFNTLVLLGSGLLLTQAVRAYEEVGSRSKAFTLFIQSVLLGGFFVAFQGYEWMNLLRYGMTISSGLFAATFYLIIGSHAVHAFGAILAMLFMLPKVKKQTATVDGMKAMRIFWLFVVGIWPVLYGLVYFG
jgi:heme/copper-type cytochrome/quinol oxidase subunit 3